MSTVAPDHEVSGVFLTLWDDAVDDPSLSPLQPTGGGYPHVTVVYTGHQVDQDDLMSTGQYALYVALNRRIRLTGARVNSFIKDDGTARHDVLLDVDPDSTDVIRHLRERFALDFPDVNVVARDPHVTVGIFPTREAAMVHAERVRTSLPLEARVVGVTLD